MRSRRLDDVVDIAGIGRDAGDHSASSFFAQSVEPTQLSDYDYNHGNAQHSIDRHFGSDDVHPPYASEYPEPVLYSRYGDIGQAHHMHYSHYLRAYPPVLQEETANDGYLLGSHLEVGTYGTQRHHISLYDRPWSVEHPVFEHGNGLEASPEALSIGEKSESDDSPVSFEEPDASNPAVRNPPRHCHPLTLELP
jgi:hypothetical protein